MTSDKKIWQNNGYRGAKNEPIQYEGEWRKIQELMDKMDIVVSHQKAHTADSAGAEADFNQLGNREVDELVQMGRIVLYKQVKDQLKALHEDWGHLGSQIFMKRLKDEGILYTREEVLEICNKCPTCQEQKVSNLGWTAGQHI